MSPYRVADPPPPFVSVEPDPFPESARVLDERRMRRVAQVAKELVEVTKSAEQARIYFMGSPRVLREVDNAVSRAFRDVVEAVDAWDKSRL